MKQFELTLAIIDPSEAATEPQIINAVKEMCDKYRWHFCISTDEINEERFIEILEKTIRL